MTKIDIISGFLGAGKTTFIKKMIDEVFKGEKIVLIENEFGEVGIDGGFLKDAGIQIIFLINVVFPAPKKPEIISIFVIINPLLFMS